MTLTSLCNVRVEIVRAGGGLRLVDVDVKLALYLPAPDQKEPGNVHEGKRSDMDHGRIGKKPFPTLSRESGSAMIRSHHEGLFFIVSII